MHIYPLLPSQDQPEKSNMFSKSTYKMSWISQVSSLHSENTWSLSLFFPTVKLSHFPACQVQVIVAAFFAVLQALNKYSLLKKKKYTFITHCFYGSGIWTQINWTLCFRVPSKVSVEMAARLESHLNDQMGENLQPSLGDVCRIHFLEECWKKSLSFLWDVGWRLPQFHARWPFPPGASTWKEPLREYQHNGSRGLCDLTAEVVFHQFCYILIFRNKPLDPAHTQRGKLHKSMNTSMWSHWEPF